MTEAPGNKTPSADPKPTDKSGPVKPPVLEGTARPVGGASATEKSTAEASKAEKPQGKTTTPPPRTKPAEPSKPAQTSKPAETNSGSGAPWLAALGGGLVGLAGAYGLAWFGLWPVPPQTPPAADPRIAQVASAMPELQTVTSTVQDELSTLTGRVAGLEQSLADLPSSAPDEASGELATQLTALAERVDALAATPAAAPADEAAAAQTAGELDSLRQEMAATTSQLSEAEQQLQALSDTASADSSAETELARLPLILSSLDSAFASGRPYDDALAALRQAQPSASVPDSIAGHAQSGLPRPEAVTSRLHDLVPDILAGRPVGADAGWQDATMDWFRGLIAMRPAGSPEGTGPEAVVARLELAVAARDFAAAKTELDALPPTMRRAAAPVAEDIAALADADAFLSGLRMQALAGEAAE